MTDRRSELTLHDNRRTVLDLFCGLGGFSAAFEDSDDWDVVTVDIEERFSPTIQVDVLDLRPSDLPDPDLILASPPCTHFSIANQPNPHWDGDEPTSPEVRESITLTFHTVGLIRAFAPDYWFLENPLQGKMRTLLGRPPASVTYCQYGFDWQKPTGLWGEHPPMTFRRCSPGADCHQAAGSGFDSGPEGTHIRDPAERSKVPYDLSESIRMAVDSAFENQPPEQSTLGSAIAIADGGSE